MSALKSIHQKIHFALVACVLLTGTFLTSCSIPISYRDAVTYKNLTDLKAEAVMLIETHPGVVL
jgi:hypothetical protein